MTTALRMLLLCDDRPTHAQNVREHIGAFSGLSSHQIELFNPRGMERPRALNLDAFDVVVIHYTLLVTSDYLLPTWVREQVAAFKGLVVQFLQDEYRWVDAITDVSRELGVGLL